MIWVVLDAVEGELHYVGPIFSNFVPATKSFQSGYSNDPPWRCADYVVSNPQPVPERGGLPGFVIEVSVDDLDEIDPAHLDRIEKVWIHAALLHKWGKGRSSPFPRRT